jgi:hypothetical protein
MDALGIIEAMERLQACLPWLAGGMSAAWLLTLGLPR